MRKSTAALAIIQQRSGWLVQWSNSWKAYSLIGGHVETGETFRECCEREIVEELECEANQFELAIAPLATLRFREFSIAAQQETDYQWQIFKTELDQIVLQNLPPDCAWVTQAQICSGVAADGKPIANQVARVLKAYNELDLSPPEVQFSGRVREQLPQSVIEQLELELPVVFPNTESRPIATISVPRLFAGYAPDYECKVVMAVEFVVADGYERHIVKLGSLKDVAVDFDGWHACTHGRMVASRIFAPVRKMEIGPDRVAVVYRDAFALFGPDEGSMVGSAPKSLENAIAWAVKDNEPDPLSAQRAISHIYTDLGLWFYRDATENPERAWQFFDKRLGSGKHNAGGPTIFERWNDSPRAELRRHAVWVLCGQDNPAADPIDKPARYLDPIDYVSWAMQDAQGSRLPRTLVGRSHGDLHARNILVGVRRGEVQYPAVFDYGDMGDQNVLAWDFAKLETELKVRRLAEIIRQPDAYQWLLKKSKLRTATYEPAANADPGVNARRADRMAAFLAFEEYINELTLRIEDVHSVNRVQPLTPPLSGIHMLDRLAGIILRIRQEAAFWLGFQHANRGARWKDELNFALAVYGLVNVRWDYSGPEQESALISAGVASSC